jgi:hypothetical protein
VRARVRVSVWCVCVCVVRVVRVVRVRVCGVWCVWCVSNELKRKETGTFLHSKSHLKDLWLGFCM